MKKYVFNSDWYFQFENKIDEFSTFGFDKYSDASGACARFLDYNNWQHVDLPHDWALSLGKSIEANTFAGSYPNTHYHRFMLERHSNLSTVYNIGWYRKQFAFDPSWKGKRVFIEFEGIFRDATVFVNGVYLDRHNSGYTSFALELTDHLVEDEENSIAVRVDSDQVEGWWYEGAGIYRNVHILVGEPTYFKYNKTFVRSKTDGNVEAEAVLVNDTASEVEQEVIFRVLNREGVLCAENIQCVRIDAYGEAVVKGSVKLESPQLWGIDAPYLYTLIIDMGEENTSVRFGIRSIEFDAERGFLLNGVQTKVRGACVHQDFGGVGVALTDNIQYYKIKRLKDMGVNAYRCAHHAPSPVLLDACDELGMLVMNETRMFGTSPEAIRQLTDLIERDRNHPSVFIWSLGNEEFSVQNKEWSFRLMEKVTRIAKELDPTRAVTYGGNNGANFVGANGAAEVRGINYIRNDKTGDWLDIYHGEHPTQPIIGTEESSYVLSRGGAFNDLGSGFLDSTGNVTMPWGSTPKGWVKYMEKRDYFAGSFMWTGFDYRGEPNPFYYANNSSSFGTIDLCGMAKPPFYYYKAWWTDEAVLKLLPHWNHNEEEKVKVAVFTNCDQITLFLNGRVIGTRRVERFDAPMFEVAFEKGALSVEGTRNGEILRDEITTSGEAREARCTCELNANSVSDISIYEINAYDENGVFCPLASNEIELIAENGEIVGVGNGDPSNFDYERKEKVEKSRIIRSFNDGESVYWIPIKRENHLMPRTDLIRIEDATEGFEDDLRIIAMPKTSSSQSMTKTLVTTLITAEDYEYIEFERIGGRAEVYLNGEFIGDNSRWHGRQAKTSNRPYRFYGDFKKGENEIRVEFKYGTYDLPLLSGEVKLGKLVDEPWHIKLHYGKARVFVKSKTPKQVKISVSIK